MDLLHAQNWSQRQVLILLLLSRKELGWFVLGLWEIILWPAAKIEKLRHKYSWIVINVERVIVVHSLNCVWLFVTPWTEAVPASWVLHCLPEFAQIHVNWVSDVIQLSHPLSPTSSPSLSLSQHKDLFLWVGFSHQVAKAFVLQLQGQSFQWKFRVDFL